MNNYNEVLCERLNFIVEKSSQSEVARKTNISPSNINRYLSGRKIPFDFCIALTKNLDVNPTWLLAGEGVPFLADVSADISQTSGDFLELVKAMNSVARMKLGELVGKDHLKTLYQLNEAIITYEKLRKELNKKTTPVFKRLLDDMLEALEDNNLSFAEEIEEYALELQQLSDDQELQKTLVAHQARLQSQKGDSEAALQLARKTFMLSLPNDVFADKNLFRITINFALALRYNLYYEEARRVSMAVLNLAGPSQHQSQGYNALLSLVGVFDVALGDLVSGMEKLQRAAARLEGDALAATRLRIVAAELLNAGLDMNLARSFYNGPYIEARTAFAFAFFFEDVEFLEECLEHCVGDEPGQLKSEDPLTVYALHLLEALKKPEKFNQKKYQKFFIQFKKSYESREEGEILSMDPFYYHVCSAQIKRLLGEKKEALVDIKESQLILEASPPKMTYPIFQLSSHYQNILDLVTQKSNMKSLHDLKGKARDFFHRYYAKGYGCFREIVRRYP